jgi:hypothetical protein
VIIKGRSNRCTWWWSQHLQDTEENERVRIAKIDGLVSNNIDDLLHEIEAHGLGLGGNAKNPFWIAIVNPGPKEHLTEQDRDRAVEILAKERGLTGQPYFVVEHDKKGWKHWHVVWSRIDAEHMRLLSDRFDAKVCHAASRKIENELGLERVIGPFDREPGTPRPPRAPEAWEMYRGMKTQIDPRDIGAEVTELYRQSQNGREFQAELERHGYQLVTGRRGLLILDSAGHEHSLARRIEGVKTAEINAFMRDVDRAALPTLEQGKAQFQERKIAGLEADRATVRDEIEWQEALDRAGIAKEENQRQFVEPKEREKEETRAAPERTQPGGREEKVWPIHPPQHQSWPGFEKAASEATRDDRTENLKGPVAQVWELWSEFDRGKHANAIDAAITFDMGRPFSVPTDIKAFASGLDEKGIMFAVASKEEAERNHREAEFARAVGNYSPRFKEGEIVIVTEQRPEYRREGDIVEPRRVHKLDQSLAEKLVAGVGGTDKLHSIDGTLLLSDNRAQQRRADREATALERASDIRDFSRIIPANAKDGIRASFKVASSALGGIGKGVDAIADGFASLFAPVLTPEQKREAEITQQRREAEGDASLDYSRYTAERTQQRRQEENDREAERQRQRDGGGRER